eukprot:6703436-Alexandrium_andersonii.AAC.1
MTTKTTGRTAAVAPTTTTTTTATIATPQTPKPRPPRTPRPAVCGDLPRGLTRGAAAPSGPAPKHLRRAPEAFLGWLREAAALCITRPAHHAPTFC